MMKMSGIIVAKEMARRKATKPELGAIIQVIDEPVEAAKASNATKGFFGGYAEVESEREPLPASWRDALRRVFSVK